MNPLIYKRAIPAYMYLYHFMINRVPTDLYRVKNPRMDVTQQGKNFSSW